MLNTLNKNTILNHDLHAFAEQRGVQIEYAVMPCAQAAAVKINHRLFIGFDYSVPENSAKERVLLAHELGHVETDAFYGIRAPEYVQKQAEDQAVRWAVKTLVPKQRFLSLLKQGLNEWELAEAFNVTAEFIQTAYHLYFECGMHA